MIHYIVLLRNDTDEYSPIDKICYLFGSETPAIFTNKKEAKQLKKRLQEQNPNCVYKIGTIVS